MEHKIKELTELRDRATHGDWNGICIEYIRTDDTMTLAWGDSDYVVALHNSFPDLIAYIESLEKKVGAAEALALHLESFDASFLDADESEAFVDNAIDTYRKQVE